MARMRNEDEIIEEKIEVLVRGRNHVRTLVPKKILSTPFSAPPLMLCSLSEYFADGMASVSYFSTLQAQVREQWQMI